MRLQLTCLCLAPMMVAACAPLEEPAQEQMAAPCSEAACQAACAEEGLNGTCAGDACQCGAPVQEPEPCGPEAPYGACPAGQWCDGEACTSAGCRPDPFEPNQRQVEAAVAPAGLLEGLSICPGDDDYWEIEVPAGSIVTVELSHDLGAGDLDLVSYRGRDPIDSRSGPDYPYDSRSYETGREAVSFLNVDGDDDRYWVRVVGASATDAAPYTLRVIRSPYEDSAVCADLYRASACEGRGAAGSGLIHFPLPDPEDALVGEGYAFDSVSNYRWARREMIMLIRHALGQTLERFGPTGPLGLIDMCQRDGVTPGYDIGDPRHPEATHDQGGNADLAYFQRSGDNRARIVCGGDETHNDGYCSAGATERHLVDLEKQIYFMAQLYASDRVRVIGVDRVLAPLLKAEADRQLSEGMITTAQRQGFDTRMASGEGWAFHHHHIHLSLQWWD